jgi:putative transposase
VVEPFRTNVCSRHLSAAGEPHARLTHWRWHLDEMHVKLNGEMVYLWRAVDQEGEVLESSVTRTRDKVAALTFMRKALKRHGSPERITTDGLRSYRAAMIELGCEDKQDIGRWANSWVENSHLPFRRRERAMLRFRQMQALQKFASVHASLHNHFCQERQCHNSCGFHADPRQKRTAVPSRHP